MQILAEFWTICKFKKFVIGLVDEPKVIEKSVRKKPEARCNKDVGKPL